MLIELAGSGSRFICMKNTNAIPLANSDVNSSANPDINPPVNTASNQPLTGTNMPLTEEGVVSFLSSPWVEGIGPTYARRLVDRFGTDAPDILANNPERATEVEGLGETRVNAASESLKHIPYPLPLLIFLFSCKLGDTFIDRIFAKYKRKTADVIANDPYSMVEDVWQLSFFTADKIGYPLGIADDDPRRLQGALVTAVKHYAENGHLFATPEEATAYASRITGVAPETVAAEIAPLVDRGRIVSSHGGLYLPVFYKAEKEGAERLKALSANQLPQVSPDDIPTASYQGHTYTPSQREAIRKALTFPVMVLTGGPGSGKTTVLRGVIELLEKEGKKVVLAAPTGRAAKRMSTLTGREASTIHRLLGYRQGEGYSRRAVDADVLIIDEGSMMEQVLFNHLLQGLRPDTRIILVGDTDQLPAIGAGDVLRDLIKSGAVTVAHLDENFRQGAGSLIAAGARAINRGELPPSDPDKDFMILPESSPKLIHDRIISLIADEIPQSRGISPADLLIVTPQQIGILGARQLNSDIQQRVNPSGPELRRGATVFRAGDPVMQTANSPERKIYNGEVGRVVAVDPAAQTLTVKFADGRESVYHRSELSELTLAYATTVHKLQGSEAKNIIIPVTMAHKAMLYRNLLYTGVSRATDLCILVGEEEALRYAIRNAPADTRNSNFALRLGSTLS